MTQNYASVFTIDQGLENYHHFLLDPKEYPKVRRGDIFVDTAHCGYRTQGVYFVDINSEGQYFLRDKEYKPDDYGVIPSSFRVISDFPPSWWHCETMTKVDSDLFYFHSNIVWFDPHDIKKTFTGKDIEIFITGGEVLVCLVFEHNSETYCICFSVDPQKYDEENLLNQVNKGVAPYSLPVFYDNFSGAWCTTGYHVSLRASQLEMLQERNIKLENVLLA